MKYSKAFHIRTSTAENIAIAPLTRKQQKYVTRNSEQWTISTHTHTSYSQWFTLFLFLFGMKADQYSIMLLLIPQMWGHICTCVIFISFDKVHNTWEYDQRMTKFNMVLTIERYTRSEIYCNSLSIMLTLYVFWNWSIPDQIDLTTESMDSIVDSQLSCTVWPT